MKIFVTGICGMLGKSLVRILKEKYAISGCDIISSSYSKIDINDKELLKFEIMKIRPDIIIHAASIINVEKCEKEQDLAYKINVEGNENIVSICKEQKIKLIHISSSAIFDGKKYNYVETDKPNPLNYYSKTKLLQEEIIIKELKNYLILRTNIYGWRGWIVWLIFEILSGQKVEIFNNIISNILFVDQLSQIIDQCIKKKLTGIYNVGTQDAMSKYDIAKELCKTFGYNDKNIVPAKFNLNIPHPLNLVLNCDKIKNENIELPTIKNGLIELRDTYNYYK